MYRNTIINRNSTSHKKRTTMNKLNNKTTKKSVLLLSGVLMLSAFFLPYATTANSESQIPVLTSSSQTSTSTDSQAVSWPTIHAKSAFIYDPVSSIVVYEKNADEQRPIASLLKVMTAAVADDILDMAPGLAQRSLTIPRNLKNENAADFAIQNGSRWTTENLIQVMLIGSSNKAAETIANGLIPRSSFMSLMNFNARRLGLTQTYFRNPTGLTEALPGQKTALTGTSTEGRLDIAGGVSTAREFAKLMWSVIAENPGLLDATHQDSIMVPNMNNKNKNIVTEFKVDNTNKLLKDYPIRFGKTGFTDNAGGNLAVVLQRSETSNPYVIVVLGSTLEHRFEDVAKLASTTLMLYTK